MANKRTLKRCINLVCEDLFTDCIAASLYGAQASKNDADALLYTIVKTQRNYISRVSHVEPGMNAKAYFRDLRDKFTAEAADIADHICSL